VLNGLQVWEGIYVVKMLHNLKKKILDGKLTDSFKNVNCEFAKNVEIEKKVNSSPSIINLG
jgi:hypothetical protein